ncbi:MAG TPA: DUF1003 domain-containing protein [Actinomycetota bacterium]|nr:DUF1003 domain-containing protein [Actinomycetota bacterium]
MSDATSTVDADVRREQRRQGWYPWSRRQDMRHPVVRKAMDDRTLGERVADRIAGFGGSWPFIFLFLGLIFGWMVLNSVVLSRALHAKAFDPYPYIALNLMLSALAGLQAPVILMSQNRAAARDEALAGHHYEESQKMERILRNTQELLQTNTELTQQVHDLTRQIRTLVGPGDS